MPILSPDTLLARPTPEQINHLGNNITKAHGIGSTGDLGPFVEAVHLFGIPAMISPIAISQWEAYANANINKKDLPNVAKMLHDLRITSPLPDLKFLNAIFPLWLQMMGSKALVKECALALIHSYRELARQKEQTGVAPLVLEGGLSYHLLCYLLAHAYGIPELILHPYAVADSGISQTSPQFVPDDLANMIGRQHFQDMHQALAFMSRWLVNPQTAETVWRMIPDEDKRRIGFRERFFAGVALGDPGKDPNVVARFYTNRSGLILNPEDMANNLFELPEVQPLFEPAPANVRKIIDDEHTSGKHVILFTLGAMLTDHSPADVGKMLENAAEAWNSAHDTQKIFFVYVDSTLPEEDPLLQSDNMIRIVPASYSSLGMDGAFIHGGLGTSFEMKRTNTPTVGFWNLPEQMRNTRQTLPNQLIADIQPAKKFSTKAVLESLEQLVPKMTLHKKERAFEAMRAEQQQHLGILTQAMYYTAVEVGQHRVA